MSSYPPYIAYPSAPPVLRVVPDPPRLHWGLVLVLSVVTAGIFGQIWLIVQCVWVRKVYGRSKALPWAIAYLATLPAAIVAGFLIGVVGVLTHRSLGEIQAIANMLTLVVQIAIFVLFLVTAYTLRGELESDPINIPLGGVMTFFFSVIYFQYHLYDYTVPDEVHAFRGPLRPDLPLAPSPPQQG